MKQEFLDILSKENTILYSEDEGENYVVYVGVGDQEFDSQDPDSWLLPDDRTTDGWLQYSLMPNSIKFIVAINYLMRHDYLIDDFLPNQSAKNFKKNLTKIKIEVEKWFMPDTCVFNYLEIHSDEQFEEDDIEELEENIFKYKLWGSDCIIINEFYTGVYQSFIPKTEIENLKRSNDMLRKLIFDVPNL